MTTMQHARPDWYTRDDETAWERVKDAFRRDWRQTKHDFGGNEPDLNQGVGDTVSQATGSKPIPSQYTPNPKNDDESDEMYNEHEEEAYRFGYAAYRHHGSCREWNAQTESTLRSEWGDDTDWMRHRQSVLRGWMYAKNEGRGCGTC